MNGSVSMQFLYAGYHNNLANVVTQYAAQIMGAVGATAQGAVMLYIIITGHRLMYGGLSWETGMGRIVRAIIVTALLSAANYQTFVGTPVTQTIPNWIANAVTGAQGLQGAQGFDALLNQIQHFSAQAREQMVGFIYIGDRVVIWLVGQMAEIVILGCFFIWSLATAAADILVPLGGVLIPFYLFDATRGFVERWYGKILALFVVNLLALMLGQIVVYEDAQYVQQFANAIAAAPPNPGFVAPDPGAGELMFPPTTPGGAQSATINTDAAIDTLGNALLVFTYGLFLLAIVTGIGLYIGGASGFSAAPAFNLATRGLGRMVRA